MLFCNTEIWMLNNETNTYKWKLVEVRVVLYFSHKIFTYIPQVNNSIFTNDMVWFLNFHFSMICFCFGLRKKSQLCEKWSCPPPGAADFFTVSCIFCTFEIFSAVAVWCRDLVVHACKRCKHSSKATRYIKNQARINLRNMLCMWCCPLKST